METHKVVVVAASVLSIASLACGSEIRIPSGGGGTGVGGSVVGGGGGTEDACPPPPCSLLEGCKPEILIDPGVLVGVVGPVATEHYLYWGHHDDSGLTHRRLARVSRCGGETDEVMAEAGFLRSMTSVGDALFLGLREAQDSIDEPPPAILRRSDDDSELKADGTLAVTDLRAVGGHVLWLGSALSQTPLTLGVHVMDPESLGEVRTYADDDASYGATADQEHLYWGGASGVRRAPLTGPPGQYEDVLPLGGTGDVVISGDWLVAHDAGGTAAALWVAHKDGSDAVSVAEGFILPFLETDDNGWVYFSRVAEDMVTIVRFQPPSGELQALVSGDLRGDFEVDRGWLYAYFADLGLVRVPLPTN